MRVTAEAARNSDSVIPGWSEGPDPESRDSGFDAMHRPGMTVSRYRPAYFSLTLNGGSLPGGTVSSAIASIIATNT